MAAILGINFRSYLDVNVKMPSKTDTTFPANIRKIIPPVSFYFVATPIGSNKAPLCKLKPYFLKINS